MKDFDILQIQKDRIRKQKRQKAIGNLLLKFKNIEMKDGTKNVIAACILALGLITASIIYAYSTRYTVISDRFGYGKRIDKWEGTCIQLKESKY